MSKPAMQRTDAASTRLRDEMRTLAKRVARQTITREDGWKNALTLLGMVGRDKRLSATHMTERVTDLEAEDIWRGDDMFARAVNTVPEEITRAGWELLVQPPKKGSKRAKDAAADVTEGSDENANGKEISEKMSEWFKEFGLVEMMEFAQKVERAKGGAAIILGVDDGEKDWSKPLRLDRVKRLDWADVLEPLELIPYQWFADQTKKDFGKPELYWMQRIPVGNVGATQRVPVHESRLILFPGVIVGRRQLREHWGWGDSILVRMHEVLKDFAQAWGGAGALMQDFSQTVFGIEGLTQAFASGEDDLLQRRAVAMDAARSIVRGIIIDKNETFTRQTTPIGGLPEMLDRFALRLAAAIPMPVTLLMGQSPAGLNATGASDIRSFYDGVGATRPRKLEPRLNRITKVVFRSKEGPTKGVEPERWSYKFGSMWQQTEQEIASTRATVATTDNTYITAGVLLPEEVAKSRFSGDAWSMETVLDHGLRQAFDEKKEADDEAAKEAAAVKGEVAATVNGTKAQVSAEGEGAPKQPPTKEGAAVPPEDIGPQQPPPIPYTKNQGPSTGA